jgi:hypothetical protein
MEETKKSALGLPEVTVGTPSIKRPRTVEEVVEAALADAEARYRATFDRLVKATPDMLGL